MLVCLIILTITFFGLTLYSIVQANLALFHIEASRLFSLKILDTSSSATLFVTLLGALLVRHQFALSVLPRINYRSAKATRQSTQNPNESSETWRVEIRNTGLGSAIINRSEYVLETVNDKNDGHPNTFEGIIQELAILSLERERDY